MKMGKKREQEARELVNSSAVKRYIIDLGAEKGTRERYIVVGNKEYLVDENVCTCDDYQRQISSVKRDQPRIPLCKHILALRIAQSESKWDTFRISVEEYRALRPYLWGKKI